MLRRHGGTGLRAARGQTSERGAMHFFGHEGGLLYEFDDERTNGWLRGEEQQRDTRSGAGSVE